MNRTALSGPIPIRFPKSTRLRVQSVARRFGVKPSQLVRQAVTSMLPVWERSGQIILGSDR